MDKKGWGQRELARQAKVSQGSIGNVIRGDRQPGPDLCHAIARALKLPPEAVFRAAGILPEVNQDAPGLEEFIYIYVNAATSHPGGLRAHKPPTTTRKT
ncbi:MAG: helix-turn-helix transcriptional regulator [Anaerolineales bacterium]|nr:helix-turn-helix transcriptional regulator [Anaerolineales bacterium]